MLGEFSRAVLLRIGPHAIRDDHGQHREHHATLRRAAAELERELFLAGHYRALAFSNGPCEGCKACDRSRPCPDPVHARPSMEACGIDVYATVRAAGWEIDVVRDGRDTYRFFALVLVD